MDTAVASDEDGAAVDVGDNVVLTLSRVWGFPVDTVEIVVTNSGTVSSIGGVDTISDCTVVAGIIEVSVEVVATVGFGVPTAIPVGITSVGIGCSQIGSRDSDSLFRIGVQS